MAKAKIQATETLPAVMPQFKMMELPSYNVTANFGEVEQYLKGTVARYKDVAFSPENMDEVIKVNGEMVGLRTSLKSVCDNVKKIRFNGPKDIFQKQMDALIAIAGEIEVMTKKVIDAKDQERIVELTEVLESYKQHFQTVFSLEDSYLARVELKEKFFNKTAKEKESKEDIEAQFLALKKEQSARNGSIKLIGKALADTPQINQQAQIDKLDRGEDIASILEWIEGEQARLADLSRQEEEHVDDPEEEEEDDDVGSMHQAGNPAVGPGFKVGVGDGPATQAMRTIAGVAKKMDFSTDFPGNTKNAYICITYPIDTGPELNKLFTELASFDIKLRYMKAGESVPQ